MKLPRRNFLHLAATTAALPALPSIARGQAYPTRPVRIIVGFAAGGGADTTARLVVQWLSERLGQQFIIENRPGAGSNIGAEAVTKAPADGYTLLLVTTANAINATLYDKLNFEFARDIAAVAGIMRVPNVMEVNPSLPVKTIPEFIAYANSNPRTLNYASGGSGTTAHVAGELFRSLTGVNMQHVPYRGIGPALTDLLAGQVPVMFDAMSGSIEHIRAGRLRALAVTTAARSEALPDVPPLGEFVPGFEVGQWYGVGVPKNTPADIIGRLNKEINVGLADPRLKVRLADLGGTVLVGSPADFGKLVADETEKWAKVVKSSGAKLD